MCVYRNTDARSRNQCNRENAIRIRYDECVHNCLNYPTCKAHAPYYIVMWPALLYLIYPNFMAQTARFH